MKVYGSLSGGDEEVSDSDSELGDVLNSDDSGLLSGSASDNGRLWCGAWNVMAT